MSDLMQRIAELEKENQRLRGYSSPIDGLRKHLYTKVEELKKKINEPSVYCRTSPNILYKWESWLKALDELIESQDD